MKKQVLIMVMLFVAATLYAQQSAYVSLGAGVGLGTARTYDLYQDYQKVYPVALGKGLDFNLRAGYFLGEHIAAELGIGYRMGFSTKIDVDMDYPELKSTYGTGWMKFKSNMLYLVPAILIQPNIDAGSLRPYARLGVIIGILPSMITKMDITSTYSGYSENTVGTIKYYGGVAVGGSFALGTDINISDLLAVYAEIYYDALSYAPSKGKITKMEENGKDVLPDFTTGEKEVKFVKELTNFTYSDSEPDQELKNSYPLNSLGLNIGVKVKLGK